MCTSNMGENGLFIYVTAPDKESALKYCETLVRERLAACANVLEKATSIYWWNDRIQTATECVCIFKTSKERFEAFLARAKEIHPYEVPCIVAWPLERGNPEFMRWISEETRS